LIGILNAWNIFAPISESYSELIKSIRLLSKDNSFFYKSSYISDKFIWKFYLEAGFYLLISFVLELKLGTPKNFCDL
jgi:hypothetical protein